MLKKLLFILIFINILTAQKISGVLNEAHNFYLQKDYSGAINLLEDYLKKTKKPEEQILLLIEIGDIYFDKLSDLEKAQEIYERIVAEFPKSKYLPDVLYRLGLLKECQEDFLGAAQIYEQVATKYFKSRYAPDALEAIERCFKKNYQERVAYIDNYPITQIEFDERIARNPAAYEKFEAKLKLLDEMINERLMLVEAQKRNLFNLEDVQSPYFEQRKMLTFNEWYNDQIVNKIKVSEKEKKKYYKEHLSDYLKPEKVRCREILVATLPEAESLRARILRKDLDFDSIAKDSTVSLAATRDRGGDLGYFKRGTYPKNIEKVAFSLKVSEISKPIKTKDGFLLLKCEDKKPKEEKKYKDVAKEIETRLKNEKVTQFFDQTMQDLKKKANVIIDTIALQEAKDTVAFLLGFAITSEQLEERIAKIPPFFRRGLETPEGKKRFLEQVIQEYLILKETEAHKYWLKNNIFNSLLERKEQLLINQLRKIEVIDKIIISEEELKNEYKKTIKDFFVPEQVKAREIVVRTQELAEKVSKKLKMGKVSFDSLVKEYSVAASKHIGGDLGYFSKEDKPKPIADFAFKAKIGEISKPIKLDDTTYIILKKEEHKKAHTRPFEEVKGKIERKLKRESEEKRYNELLADLRSKAKIEVLLAPEEKEEERD